MGDVINLRMVRKANGRAAKETQASANRAAFGRTKTEREAAAVGAARHDAALDGARLEQAVTEPPAPK